MAKLEALHAKPAQLKQLQARLGQLAISSDTVQDFPLFQAVTGEPSGRRPGSMTSRSDSSTQVSFLSTSEPAQQRFKEEMCECESKRLPFQWLQLQSHNA